MRLEGEDARRFHEYMESGTITEEGRELIHEALDMVSRQLEILLTREKEGGYTIEIPSWPGCHTQGETIEEALRNLAELIPIYRKAAGSRGL